jgi:hypothetical protein
MFMRPRLLYGEATINLDVSTVDVARQVLDEHVNNMRNFFWFRKGACWDSLLVPGDVNI